MITFWEPAVGIMAMSLDSHVANRGSSPGSGGLNSGRAHVRAYLRSREENGGEGIVVWLSPLGGDFSLSVSLWLSGERTRLIAKTSPKKEKKFKNKYLFAYYFT